MFFFYLTLSSHSLGASAQATALARTTDSEILIFVTSTKAKLSSGNLATNICVEEYRSRGFALMPEWEAAASIMKEIFKFGIAIPHAARHNSRLILYCPSA